MEIRHAVFEYAAGIDERHQAEIVEEAPTQLQARLYQAAAAQRVAVVVLRADALEGESAHRTAAAGIEPPRIGDSIQIDRIGSDAPF